ncbi:Glutamyl-tRNA(Gln) amidotransferase subunit A [Hordeum vulgare]|nr:Glutamyl-tRNA(Gln) amidotransferase subunit A [Hordeum vulgare]
MNFQDVYTREQAHDLTPPSRLITNQDREEHRRRQRRLLVAEEDERAMAEWRWRHPEHVAVENAFWAERAARRREELDDRRRRKALAISQCEVVNNGGTSIFTSDDERWEDAWLSTSDSSDNDDSE